MYNFFQRVDETIITPPFLVVASYKIGESSGEYYLQIDSVSAARRHIERMAAKGVTLDEPQQDIPLNALAMVGLVFDQQEALQAALLGRYAETYWPDYRPALAQRYPHLNHALGVLWNENQAVSLAEMRRILPDIIRRTGEEINQAVKQGQLPDLLLFAPDFLYRAWLLRQQVVDEARALSLLPVVGGDIQGDTLSFTPVFKRLGETTWRLGWPGDAAPVSPKEFIGPLEEVLPQVLVTYSDWYHRDQGWTYRQLKEKADARPGHIFIPVWAERLRLEKTLRFGAQSEAVLTNLSHGRLFELRLPDGVVVQFESSPVEAVRLACFGGDKAPLYASRPGVEEIEAAYLKIIGKKTNLQPGEPGPGQLAPFSPDCPDQVHLITAEETQITVAWAGNYPQARAVISGSDQPARAILGLDAASQRMGIAPFSFQTRKPDTQDMWASSPVVGLNLDDPAARRAISAWAASVWQDRAALKKYRPGSP